MIFIGKLDICVVIYLDYILFYTKNTCKRHVKTVYSVLNQLPKYELYDNLKKCRFYHNKFQFLEFIILAKGI